MYSSIKISNLFKINKSPDEPDYLQYFIITKFRLISDLNRFFFIFTYKNKLSIQEEAFCFLINKASPSNVKQEIDYYASFIFFDDYVCNNLPVYVSEAVDFVTEKKK
ncbi:hypothetical protein BpHYR1_048288 [Brachionus plicatilis]|uniref:Uncharacterized protein n=1 Tax=Brachionus plicatilis TaxID=10195 RepID=A0A3M7Q1W9_BRAPC|nr:hypothetical protein BpHYR1_048288 [Brachionus plicatilis]